MTLIVIGVVSGALILGAFWGACLPLSSRVKGALMAFAGGALITSLAFELFKPATEQAGVWWAGTAFFAGAGVFTGADYLIDEVWESKGGLGLLAAVTVDGVPENLALGVSLIGASFSEVAALAAAILASNLPEAAGGAKDLTGQQGWSAAKSIGLWAGAAVLLSAAAWVGHTLMASTSDTVLALTRAFAGAPSSPRWRRRCSRKPIATVTTRRAWPRRWDWCSPLPSAEGDAAWFPSQSLNPFPDLPMPHTIARPSCGRTCAATGSRRARSSGRWAGPGA